jgi:hypothetical protein
MPDLISLVYPDQYVKLRGSDRFLRNPPGREMDAMTVALLDIPFPLGRPKPEPDSRATISILLFGVPSAKGIGGFDGPQNAAKVRRLTRPGTNTRLSFGTGRSSRGDRTGIRCQVIPKRNDRKRGAQIRLDSC